MNYIIEDNLDFNAALLHLCTIKSPTSSAFISSEGNSYHAQEMCEGVKLENEVLTVENSVLVESVDPGHAICLISHQPLTRSHIQLPCNHLFNYKPLFQEICIQKLVRNLYNTTKLKINQLKCPYCRSISEHLLPYLPSEERIREYGVNGPAKYCMPYIAECEYKVTGKKINKCLNPACYIGPVNYCKTHYLKEQKGTGEVPIEKLPIPWTPAMTTFCKTKTVIELKQMLRTHKLLVGGKKKELVERIFANNLTV
jgi:hypothetical protein